ncbi:cell envelope integrity protein CreD [Pseudaestuariivita rosea]|uniref:cell envelope integrity protein CreD n=1 Tax=Pseudaestuariivita rosea TaxID=2763263 RepID=UPI001ABB57F6|nr:cell envelope integrity protein CreD [Pseudaestuariivita rosea]
MRWSAGLRFLIVGLLVLLMFIPLFFVGSIIDSRDGYSRSSVQSVGREWGGRQTISGPQLVIPVEGPVTRTEQRNVRDPQTNRVVTQDFEVTEIVRKASIYVYPDRFDVALNTTSQERSRGIFVVPVYSADLETQFDFDVSDVEAQLDENETALWDQTYLRVIIDSNRALRGEAEVTANGRSFQFMPLASRVSNTNGLSGPVVDERLLAIETFASSSNRTGGIYATIGNPRDLGLFEMTLDFNGAERLFIAPVGRTSSIQMISDWPHPSFTGAFLPDQSQISDEGFQATWTIPHLARALPQTSRTDYDSQARREAFGVLFFQPNDFYQKAYRAARYGILFIALTFLTVLLIEGRTGKPTHPVQYILIGLAQSIFVLLMVSFAEQIGFGAAYALASAATIGLLTMFGFVALKLEQRAWVLGGMLTVLYAVLYLILRSADYALLAGTVLAFIALAGTMWATRNEDWYGPAKSEKSRRWFGRKDETPPASPSPG